MILCIFQLKRSTAQDVHRLEFSHKHMGTTFRIIVYAEDTLTAKKVIDSVFSRIDALNAVFSDYDSESE